MGVATYIKLERSIPEVDDTRAYSKLVSRNYERLEEIATQAGVPTLMEFFCEDSREQLEAIAEEMDEPPPSLLKAIEEWKEIWHDSADGLKTIDALIARIRQDSSALQNPDATVEDLDEMRVVLRAASEKGVRFHTGVDY